MTFSKRTNFNLRDVMMSDMMPSLHEASQKEESEDSVDAQIDRFLISYEKDSKKQKRESFNFRNSILNFLTEAEEGEGDKDAEETKNKLNLDEINIENFVNDVMRLVANYDSLLEIRDTILKRALNYLSKNYEKDAIVAFEDELMDAHGVKIGKSRKDIEDEEFKAPKAGAAGPGGGGG